MMSIGVILIGLAISLLRLADFGTDPFTTMNLGISSFLSMSFGDYQVIVNSVLLSFVMVVSRKHIGLVILVNMALVGYIFDFFMEKFKILHNTSVSMFVRISFLAVAIYLMSLRIAMYMCSALGVAPYDTFPLIIENKTSGRFSFQNDRIVLDILITLIGFSFGTTVGIGKVITALFTGSFFQLFRKK